MKIVAFEGQGGPHLGVVEGDQVVNLQAADTRVPGDLGEWLAKNNGDAKPLADIAKRAPADNMMFPVVEMLVYITEGITLEPGDVIFTGTPSGVGHARKPPAWMKNGDTCEVEIQGIGVLRNPIADE